MFEVALRNFRGFHSIGFQKIRPITILVGENSAGKSSFLAATKYLLDFLSGQLEPSFNQDPYQLGTFQQISHFRGGSAGRARQFTLSLRAEVAPVRREDNLDPALTQIDIVFTNSDSQAAISEISVSVRRESLVATVAPDGLNITYVAANRTRHILEEKARLPRVARTDFARYWPFFLQDLAFRVRRTKDTSQQQLFENDPTTRISIISQYAEGLSRIARGHVEATSAIRTKPQRTYTPGAEVKNGEGTHVPYEMAKLYRSKKEEWRKLKEVIDRFGQESQMFQEVHIKAFGQTASDPFQIQFSSDGPKTNLMDLGYGTSQILPVLYEIANSDRSTRFLIQQPEVHLHPKAQAALGTLFVDSYKENKNEYILETHSDFIVDRVRTAISQGRLTPNDVSLLFFSRKRLENGITDIPLDDIGNPISPPKAYREFFLDEQMKSLGIQ